MSDDQPQRLYRIVQGEAVSAADFMSKAQLGIPCPTDDPQVQERWGGLSLFGSEEQAKRVARRLPMLGAHIAALDIPPSAGLRAEPTPGPGNYPTEGDPGVGTSLAGYGASDMPEVTFQFEVWELESRSLIASYPDEEEALDLVFELLSAGWPADRLVLAAENDRFAPESLPAPLTGDTLVARLELSDDEDDE